jgi:hypothetical protein
MKNTFKITLFLGVVAVGIFAARYYVLGQNSTSEPGTISASVTPNIATSTIQITGSATGGVEKTQSTQLCGAQYLQGVELTTGLPLNLGTWSIASTSLSGTFTPTITQEGNSVWNCPLMATPPSQLYQYTFAFPVDVSSLAPGTYTLAVKGLDPQVGGTESDVTFMVEGTGTTTAAATGTIMVTSENANDTSISVNAAWDLSATDATNGFVCSATGELGSNLTFPWIDGTLCSGTQRTYAKVPAPTAADGGDLVGIPKTETTTVPYYSFRSIEQVPIAEKKNNSMAGQIKLSLNNIFSTVALADEVGIWNGATTTLTRYQLLTSAYNSIAFNILWNPLVADMTVSPDTIYFASSGSMSQVETIRATGAPSAKLDWTASASTASGGNWLSVSLSSNSILIDGSGSGTGTATISAASGLPNGKYQGSVTFKGYDPNNKDALVAIRTVSVTLVVTSPGGGPPYFACAAGVCEETSSTSGGSSCINACGGGSTLTAACAPSTVTLSPLETSQCVLDLNGVAQDGSWAVAPGSAGSIGTSSGVYTPSSAGTETVVGTNTDGTSADAAITVTSGGPPPLPDCASAGKCPVCSSGLTATPSSILVPESSNLSYSCSNVTECQISAPTGQFSTSPDVPVPSGNVSTTPSITTTYTLTCVNSNYATSPDNHQAGGSATVTVSGSSYCEQNPNGVGCQ